MKKLFLMAAAAATLITACQKSAVTPPAEEATISVSLSYASSTSTRNPEAAAQEQQIKDLTNGYIYILEGENIIYREPLTQLAINTDENPVEQIVGEGQGENEENMLFPSTSTVYVLANIPANIFDPSTFMTLADIEAATTTISYVAGTSVDYTEPAMGNVGGLAIGLTPTATPGKSEAKVRINPLYARVEVGGVKGDKWVSAFKLKGVYLDNYYTDYTMTGKLVAESLRDNGHDPLIGSNVASGWFGDVVPATEWTETPGTAVAPTEGVWAYHLAGGNSPRIVVEIEDLAIFEDDGNGEPAATTVAVDNDNNKFVTVKRFRNKSNGIVISALERGTVYHISSIELTKNVANPTPNALDVEVTAIVEVMDWKFVPTGVEF